MSITHESIIFKNKYNNPIIFNKTGIYNEFNHNATRYA